METTKTIPTWRAAADEIQAMFKVLEPFVDTFKITAPTVYGSF